jgi:hypothetical protein
MMTTTVDTPAPGTIGSADDDACAALAARVRSEFLEMPGLRLTAAQASRLWALDCGTSQRILDGLTSAGFLFRSMEGAYVRASTAR